MLTYTFTLYSHIDAPQTIKLDATGIRQAWEQFHTALASSDVDLNRVSMVVIENIKEKQ